MNAEDREHYYDTEIAPVMADLCKLCHTRGFSFLAAIEWRPGALGRTVQLFENVGEAMLLANAALAAKGDIDVLLTALMEDARKNGHSSTYLFKLGIPFKPLERDSGA